MIRFAIASAVAFLILGLVLLWLNQSRESDDFTQLWGYSLSGKTHRENIQFLLFDDGQERVEVTAISNINSDLAEDHITEKISVYSALFEKQRAGYAGQQTEYVSCSDQYKPSLKTKNLTNGDLKYFQGYANSRYATGICDPQDIVFLSMDLYLHCKSTQTVYEISYFVPLEGSHLVQNFLEKLVCNIN